MNPNVDSSTECLEADGRAVKFRAAFGAVCIHASLWGEKKSDAKRHRTPKRAQNNFLGWLRLQTVAIDSEHFGSDSFAVTPLARIA